jgi:hypothetical protein
VSAGQAVALLISKPIIVQQLSGHYSRLGGMGLGLYYPNFLAISQQKAGKVIFRDFYHEGAKMNGKGINTHKETTV